MDGHHENNEIEAELLAIIRSLLLESGASRVVSLLTLDASFERDLGLGSLERVELLLRIEAAFSVSLPDTTIAEAQTLRELGRLVRNAGPSEPKRDKKRHRSVAVSSFASDKSASTLTEVLVDYAEADPDRPHIYLPSENGEEETITYGELLKTSRAIAQGLKARGLAEGECVAIMLPTDRTFFPTFLGVLFAGGIPVPVYPPFRLDQIEDYVHRQTGILNNAETTFLVTFQEVERLGMVFKPRLPALRCVTTVDLLLKSGRDKGLHPFVPHENDTALIQYTSGSTSDPKGVVLTHQNLLANIKGMMQAMEIVPSDVGMSWLPLYHDMGLIGAWLLPLYAGIPVAILSPFSFLSRPERWLWAIHTYRATISPAPNFAYEICAGKIKEDAIEGLDLSSWRVALNGAEPIKPETLRRFTKRFAPYGFRPETFLPVYGMAEASVGLSFSKPKSEPIIDRVSRDLFEQSQQAVQAPDSESSVLEFISCGRPLPGHEIQIVDDKGKPLCERVEGNLVFRGPSCTSGYHRNPEATASLFQDGWLCAGDLAYWAEGEIFITGRKKDLIIKGGRNLHPDEIERVVGEIPGIRKGCVAAFGVPDKQLGTESLVVVAETRETERSIRDDLVKAIHQELVKAIGIPGDLVALTPPGSIPKTSSGKIAHRATRLAYLKGKLTKRRRTELQFARLALSTLYLSSRRGMKEAGRLFYGIYLALLLPPMFVALWGAIKLLPEARAKVVVRKAARVFLRLAGIFPDVAGEGIPAKSGPMIWVANHASYVDALFLIAVLPAGVRFVAKEELLKVPMLRSFLRKGAHLTVDRKDVTKGSAKTEEIESILRDGGRVMIFPEGTLFPSAGLRPFKLGAFKAAVGAASPVCPISLNGTRKLLRDGHWLPSRRRVTITIGKTIQPKEEDWREIVRIRDLSRSAIARHCGEAILKE